VARRHQEAEMGRRSKRIRRLLARTLTAALIGTAGVAACLWVATVVWGPVGLFSLGRDTIISFRAGGMEVRHFYQHGFAPPVPLAQWHIVASANGWTTGATTSMMPLPAPIARVIPPAPRFSSGWVMGISDGTNVSPSRSWILLLPLWIAVLPGAAVGARLLVKRVRRRRLERAEGFAVVHPTPSDANAVSASPRPAEPLHS
jgi:hypothetical protein